MAGFEGPDDPGEPGRAAPKLPSWAITSRPGSDEAGSAAPPPDDGSLADLGVRPDITRPPRADPPVSRVPEHPFDVEDPFGDKQPGGASSPWVRGPADDTEVRLVDLADEFHLTTVQALEVCEASGTRATSGAVWLTVAQADAFRAAVAALDRSPVAGEAFPSWAIPPGGRPDGAPNFSPPVARSTGGAGSVAPPPRPTPPRVAAPAPVAGPAPATPGGRSEGPSVLRIVLVVVAVLALVACLVALVAVMAAR